MKALGIMLGLYVAYVVVVGVAAPGSGESLVCRRAVDARWLGESPDIRAACRRHRSRFPAVIGVGARAGWSVRYRSAP